MPSERREALDQLVEEAREDPELFHDLVFEPEEVLERLDYLDRYAKGQIVGLDPEEIIAGLIGGGGVGGEIQPGGGELENCGVTCTGGSCGVTCTGGSCGVTSTEILRRFEDPFEGLGHGRQGFFQPRGRY